MSALHPATALRNLRRLQVAAVLLSFAALGAALADSARLAVAAIVLTLILNIVVTDRIRVVVANLKGPGR